MTTPLARKKVTQPWLNQQFNENGWEERLASYTKVEIHNSLTPPAHGQPKGTLTIGNDYYDAENKLLATIFHYLKPDNTLGGSGKKSPKGLRIDGIWHFV